MDLQSSAGVHFGLYDERLVSAGNTPPDVHYINAHVGLVDSGVHFSLYLRGQTGVIQTPQVWNVINVGTTYHCVLAYDAATDAATLSAEVASTGTVVANVEATHVGGLPDDLDYLGFARDPVGDCCPPFGPGCSGFNPMSSAAVLVDNLQFWGEFDCAPPPTLHVICTPAGFKNRIWVRASCGASAGTTVAFTLDGVISKQAQFNAFGSAWTAWPGVTPGEHEVCLDECPGACGTAVCPEADD